MELRHLRYFVAVAEEENFHRAASRLHVSQSALSRQVQDLAKEIGVELLEPSGRGVKLTAVGRFFADKARSILAGVETAVEETQGVAHGQLGTVAIGFETGAILTGGAFASIVTAFRKRAPRIALDLLPMSSVEQWEALRTGKIAFGYGFYAPSDDSLEHMEIARDHLGVLLSGEHRLAKRSQLKVKDLANEPVLLQPRRLYPRLHDDIIAAARSHGVVLNVKSGAVDGEALLMQVVVGDAVSFLGERSSTVLRLTSVVWRPVVDLRVSETHVVLWRADDALSPVVRSLIESAREAKTVLRAERAVRPAGRSKRTR
ncbi:LysR substrate-binding domain-containing protein [Stigmatella sp. ncwal1]|uniref:LysR substrate-binding domain-containing protein n=1 Tax=Stigmatella ashevillensis TaxID=2995309 RepID=A0ABT5DM42_9BACT|nr:LysR substrate-binding domain-containing protein [Stigmatella ashevillena]MDC0714664.1 LysR substrate-binding domain-containing protein [Stigmatella ashevillena]